MPLELGKYQKLAQSSTTLDKDKYANLTGQKGHWEKKGLTTQWIADEPVDINKRPDSNVFNPEPLISGIDSFRNKLSSTAGKILPNVSMPGIIGAPDLSSYGSLVSEIPRVAIENLAPPESIAAIGAGLMRPSKPPNVNLPPPTSESIAAQAQIKPIDPSLRKEAPRIRTSDPNIGKGILDNIENQPNIDLQRYIPEVNLPSSNNELTSFQTLKKNPIRTVLRESRQLQTTGDLSFPLRQGISMYTRPEYWKSFEPMIKSTRTEKGFIDHLNKIKTDPDYALLKNAGVDFSELTNELGKREEQIHGVLTEKIPILGHLVRGSNRGYTAFANELRLGTGKRMLEDARRAGIEFLEPGDVINKESDKNARAIAKFVNDATGRGDLGRFEKSAVELNDLIFSPKLISSRINMFNRAADAALDNIGMKTGIIGKQVDPVIADQLRKEAIRSMLGIGALAATSIGVSKLNNAEGTEDPRSTDFGKMKIGNTRVDYTGGYQQYVRVAAQVATGRINQDDVIKSKNRWDTSERWMTNKLAPAASLIVDWMRDSNALGEKFQWDSATYDRIMPLIIQDLTEISKEDPNALPWALTSGVFGAGISSYGNRNKRGFPSMNDSFPKMPSVNLP